MSPLMINKMLWKVMKNEKKGDFKMFTIRNITPSEILCVSRLIRAQLKEDIVAEEFDIGYVSGSNLITLRNTEDMVGLWSTASKGGNMLLWCDGLRPNGAVANAGKKRKVPESATTAQSKKDTADQVQQHVQNLKKKVMVKNTHQYSTAYGVR